MSEPQDTGTPRPQPEARPPQPRPHSRPLCAGLFGLRDGERPARSPRRERPRPDASNSGIWL